MCPVISSSTIRSRTDRLRERGAALIEMAFVLPVLITCFVGVIEIGQWITESERITKTVNQLSAVLYTLRPSDLQAGGTANTVIGEAIRQSQTLARPFRAPTITVRYCQRRGGGVTSPMEEIYFGATTPRITGCGDGPACQAGLLTQSGYGAYVQAYACQKFQPAVTPRFFKEGGAKADTMSSNGGSDILITQVAFIPLNDTNQTALIKKAGGVSIDAETGTVTNNPIIVTPPACGGAGQPACPVVTTCGGAGQPACTTCGGTGQPACNPTVNCGGAGQPSCNANNPTDCQATGGTWSGGSCSYTCGGPDQSACNVSACPTGYQPANGGNYCYINPSCTPGAPGCTTPCPSPSVLKNGGCQIPNNCTGNEFVDGNTGKCVQSCPAASLCPSGLRDASNCNCLPSPTCTSPEVNVGGKCTVVCGYGMEPKASGCGPICTNAGEYFSQGSCTKTCPNDTTATGSACLKKCNPDTEILGPNNVCIPKY